MLHHLEINLKQQKIPEKKQIGTFSSSVGSLVVRWLSPAMRTVLSCDESRSDRPDEVPFEKYE